MYFGLSLLQSEVILRLCVECQISYCVSEGAQFKQTGSNGPRSFCDRYFSLVHLFVDKRAPETLNQRYSPGETRKRRTAFPLIPTMEFEIL